MTDTQLSKLDVAQRQLVTAIRLLFAGQDALVVHTIAGAASGILSHLSERAEKRAKGLNWDRLVRETNGLSKSAFYDILRNDQDFLKHADRDPDATRDFDPGETEALLMLAVMHSREFDLKSLEADVFELWFLALHTPAELAEESPYREAIDQFGNLRALPRSERLRMGREALATAAKDLGSAP